jgi:cysteine desulfurase
MPAKANKVFKVAKVSLVNKKAKPKASVKTKPKASVKAKPKTKPKASVKTKPKAGVKAKPKTRVKAKLKKETKIKPGEWLHMDTSRSTVLCAKAEKVYRQNINKSAFTGPVARTTALDCAKTYLLKICNAKSTDYSVHFTSGEIESNRIILCCATCAYRAIRHAKPHVIISSVEHESIITYAQSLYDSSQIDLTIIRPNTYGCILSDTVAGAIKPTTCLVMITHINHDLGSVNNIEKIAINLHEHRIPLHSDCSLLFGKHSLNLSRNCVDSATITFDTIGGPTGIGALIINNKFAAGYRLQNHSTTLSGRRAYNVPLIMAAIEAAKDSLISRKRKNAKTLAFRNEIIEKLGEKAQIMTFANFMKSDDPPLADGPRPQSKLVILGPPCNNVAYYTPGILSFLVVSGRGKTAADIQASLEKKGIAIGLPYIGSCSDTDDPVQSTCIPNMYDEIGVPPEAQQFIVRISLADSLTQANITQFIEAFRCEI